MVGKKACLQAKQYGRKSEKIKPVAMAILIMLV